MAYLIPILTIFSIVSLHCDAYLTFPLNQAYNVKINVGSNVNGKGDSHGPYKPNEVASATFIPGSIIGNSYVTVKSSFANTGDQGHNYQAVNGLFNVAPWVWISNNGGGNSQYQLGQQLQQQQQQQIQQQQWLFQPNFRYYVTGTSAKNTQSTIDSQSKELVNMLPRGCKFYVGIFLPCKMVGSTNIPTETPELSEIPSSVTQAPSELATSTFIPTESPQGAGDEVNSSQGTTLSLPTETPQWSETAPNISEAPSEFASSTFTPTESPQEAGDEVNSSQGTTLSLPTETPQWSETFPSISQAPFEFPTGTFTLEESSQGVGDDANSNQGTTLSIPTETPQLSENPPNTSQAPIDFTTNISVPEESPEGSGDAHSNESTPLPILTEAPHSS